MWFLLSTGILDLPAMVYNRKTTRGNYGMSVLEEAVHKVKNGELSKRMAERIYGVPKKTLSRHLDGKVQKPGSLGRFDCVLPANFETALVDHVVKLQSMLFGLSTTDIRKLAYELAEQQHFNHQFKGKIAGKGWLRGFLSRHPELSIRNPEPTSIGRAMGFNLPSKDRFFQLYQEQLNKEKFTASRIYNMDESGLTVVHKPHKILAKRGQKQVGRITSGEKGETMTVICCTNATGSFVPPMLIFKRKRMSDLLLRGSPPGSIGGCSANGWIDSTLFLQWLEHFIENVHASPTNKALLIVDGHSSHKSLAAIDMARNHGISMVCLPPHTTHRMQPLDLTFFGPLKKNYNKECDKWMTSNPGRRITTFDQAALFGAAYVKSVSMEKAVKGFESPGLWPFDPDRIPEEEFLPSMVTDQAAPVAPGESRASTDFHLPSPSGAASLGNVPASAVISEHNSSGANKDLTSSTNLPDATQASSTISTKSRSVPAVCIFALIVPCSIIIITI